jgi:hypothetical protein
VAATAGPQGPPFTFGGISVRGAYTVTVAADGSITALGAGGLARIKAHVGSSQIAQLNREVMLAQFGELRRLTRCPGAAATSATWVRVETRKVTVVGACVGRYQRLLRSLITATGFYVSG